MPGAATWSLEEEDYQRISGHLNELLRESNARCALLVDRAGQLLASVGEPLTFDADPKADPNKPAKGPMWPKTTTLFHVSQTFRIWLQVRR